MWPIDHQRTRYSSARSTTQGEARRKSDSLAVACPTLGIVVNPGRSEGQILIPVSAISAKAGWSVGTKRFRSARTRASAASWSGFGGCALRAYPRQSGFYNAQCPLRSGSNRGANWRDVRTTDIGRARMRERESAIIVRPQCFSTSQTIAAAMK
jgi:hypothetical protein